MYFSCMIYKNKQELHLIVQGLAYNSPTELKCFLT